MVTSPANLNLGNLGLVSKEVGGIMTVAPDLDSPGLRLDEPHRVVFDLGYIDCCRCPSIEQRDTACDHVIQYVSKESDAALLKVVEKVFPNLPERDRSITVWVPFIANGRLVADTLVALNKVDAIQFGSDVDVSDLWFAWFPLPMHGKVSDYSSLGFIRTDGFSRRRLSQRAAQQLMLLAQHECNLCAYVGPDLALSASKGKPLHEWAAEDRVQLLRRGAIMASSNSCDICADMMVSVRQIKHSPHW